MEAAQHAKALNALTDYDRRQRARKGFNPHALGHYCKALADMAEDVRRGRTPRVAAIQNFNGRLLDVVLRSIGEAGATEAEHKTVRSGPLSDQDEAGDEHGTHGRCDECGKACDANGCIADRAHEACHA